MRAVLAASVLALLCACASSDGKLSIVSDANGFGLDSDGGNGDSGTDGGDAGLDAGFDGGCIHGSFNGTAFDFGCFGPAQPMTATVFEGTQSFCSASIIFGNGSRCDGVFSGPANAFDGGCTNPPLTSCTSPSIPGVITCSGGCQVRICDGGTCP